MAEKRVIGAQRKIGGGQAAPVPAAPPEPEAPPRRRGKVVVLALVLVAALAAGAYVFLRPAEAAPEEVLPGATVAIEPRNINLDGGHYLRMGFAVQLVAEAEEIATAQATDIAIALFSGRTVEEVNDPEQRAALKDQLTSQLAEAYDGEVLTVYFTDFVTQ